MTTKTSTASSSYDGSATRRWTGSEFLRLADLGFFDNERVELIDGEVIKMSPTHNAHAAAVYRLNKLLGVLPEERFWVRVQATLELRGNYPDPDVAVVAGPVTTAGTFPTAALLVVEVSDSTLTLDRTRKMSLYAFAGVPEYWIVNIRARQFEIFRNSIRDENELFGYRYGDLQSVLFGQSIAPLFEPALSIPVSGVID